MKPIRLFLLDDHQIILDGVRSLLQDEPAFEIVGEATRSEDALVFIPRCRPDVVISDIALPGMNGIGFCRKLRSSNPEVRILILTMSSGDHNIDELIRIGVSGYVMKNAGGDELKKALQKIANGGNYFSSEVAEGLLRMKDGVSAGIDSRLTARELEVLGLIAKEYPNKKIAATLFISERTVESHRKNIFRKTGAKTIVGLIRWAIDNGYLRE